MDRLLACSSAYLDSNTLLMMAMREPNGLHMNLLLLTSSMNDTNMAIGVRGRLTEDYTAPLRREIIPRLILLRHSIFPSSMSGVLDQDAICQVIVPGEHSDCTVSACRHTKLRRLAVTTSVSQVPWLRFLPI